MTYRLHWICNDGTRHMDIIKSAKSRDKMINSLLGCSEIEKIFYYAVHYNGDFEAKKIVK